MRFWDASAIVPLCVEEPATARLTEMAKEDESLAAWWGSPVECCSAFAGLRRDGTLTEADEELARDILARLSEAWTEIQPSRAVRETAARVLRLHPLRSQDSLQLAAALVWTQGRPSDRGFVCCDRRLGDAARREGFRVLPPEG